MPRPAAAAVVALSLILAAVRVWGAKSPAYQAIAHLWVGWWFGWGVKGRARLAIGVAVGLTVVEILCFLARV